MAWYSGLFGDTTGLSDQDQQKIANQGLLRAGLGILAANSQVGVSPFQAISSGLLGGLDSVQQGASDLQNSRYKQAIMQSTMANMQNAQAQAKRDQDKQDALHQALLNNTDAGGNVNIEGAVREYGKKYPEDAAATLVSLHGGKPDIKDTSQGAMQIYPDGYNAYLQAGGQPQQTSQPQPVQSPQPGLLGPYNPPPPLLAAVQQVESGGNPNAVSPKGASGLLQVMPGTAANPGFGITPSNGTPQDTYRVGQQYLGALTNKYGTVGGLAAYNWGPGNWDKALAANNGNPQAALAGAPAETQAYVPKVLAASGQPQQAPPSALPPGRVQLSKAGVVPQKQQEVEWLVSQGYPRNQAIGMVFKTPTAADAAPSVAMAPDGTPLSGNALLGTLTNEQSAQVKALAEGRMAFPTGTALKSAYWQDMLQKVAQYDPSFDAVNYNARAGTRKAFTSGKEAQTVNALNTVAEHLGQLSDAAESLNNTRFQPYNSAKNWLAEKTGDPDIARYQTTAKAAADEVAKVWRASGGSEADIQENLKNLSMVQSPEQLHASIGTLVNLIGGKISALQDQYAQGMGTTQQVKPLVSQGAASAFDRVLQRAGYNNKINRGSPMATPQAQGAPVADPLGILK